MKVDIEGGEWNLFAELLESLPSRQLKTLPIGQLLIELHFESMDKITNLFQSLRNVGFEVCTYFIKFSVVKLFLFCVLILSF